MPTPTLSPAEVLGLLHPSKRSKYGVRTDAKGKAERTLDGVLYASKAEMRYASKLNMLQRTGKIHSYERQVPIELRVNGALVTKMIVDFRVRRLDGDTQLIDVKGHVTPEWRLKAKLFEAIYGYKIIEVKNGR
jgi:hypothetical protein